MDLLFDPLFYDVEARSVEVLGVTVPLELGARVNNFVDAAFYLLLNAVMIGFLAVLLFLPARRLKAKVPVWVVRVFVLASLAFYAWSARHSWLNEAENLRAL